MTTPTSRTMPPAAPPSVNGHRSTPRLSTPLPTTSRPKGYAALAVMLIVGLAALGYWFYTQAGAKVPVLMAAHDIPAGHVISRSDLTTVSVAGGITAVAGNHVSEVVGHTASVQILAHTPVQLSMLTTNSTLTPGQALVGIAAAPGQVPSSGLVPGDDVEVLQLPQKTATASSVSSPVLATATVYDVRPNPAVEGGVLLTLLAPKDAAYAITAASDAGLIALVQVSSQP
jgi:Flp pilus assembly protein CpaB